ncbi:cold-regulated protein 27-like isoform X1 [Musa acuminata AAA Group]|uniref:cold-regulated protein 27-like isoform X1 n=1 Tax=Musa acuminata AAA Group TaxID=214697 RepID=UPI0031D8350D
MYMGDSRSNRLSAVEEMSTIEGPSTDSRLVDSLSNGWTDEKHTLFLNSIEASFVNDLYNGEYHSKAFLGQLSRIKTHKGSCGPYENDLKSGQFKVLQTGCWASLGFDGDNNHASMENGSLPLSANPWIQHFRSPPFMKEWQFKSSDRVDDVEFIKSSFQLANERCDGEATSSKHICHQDWVGSSIEVSDQNFIADERVAGKKSSRVWRKRRRGNAVVHEPINDQVVPSRKSLLPPTSDEDHTTAESIGRTSEISAGVLLAETQASVCGNQEVNS